MKGRLLLSHLTITFLTVTNAITASSDNAMIGWIICSVIWGINVISDIIDIAMG